MSTTSAIAPSAATSQRLRSRLYILATVIVLTVFGGAYLFFARGEVSTDDAQIDGRLVPVAPNVSGYISQLLVDGNQIVTKGQVIARIDPRDLQAELNRAQAAFQTAEAQAAASQVDVPLTGRTTDSSILAAEANLSAAQAQLLEARKTAEKSHNADISVALAELADRKASYERAHVDLVRMQALIAKKKSPAFSLTVTCRQSGVLKASSMQLSRHWPHSAIRRTFGTLASKPPTRGCSRQRRNSMKRRRTTSRL